MNFFSVSKIENKDYILENWKRLQRFYPQSIYSVVTPSENVENMEQFFADYRSDIRVIDENKYISYSKFFSVFCAEASTLGVSAHDLETMRMGWYYQQILKLSHSIDSGSGQYCVMIDADTILLKKLTFFKDNASVVYTTDYEKNLPYLNFCRELFGVDLGRKWNSATTQLFSLTPFERISLLQRLEIYQPRLSTENTPEWITRLCSRAVFCSNKPLQPKASLMSEQDLVSYSNLLNNASHKKRIIYIRSTKSLLSESQLNLATSLGIAHVTYEQWLLDGSCKQLSTFAFVLALMRAIIPSQYILKRLLRWRSKFPDLIIG